MAPSGNKRGTKAPAQATDPPAKAADAEPSPPKPGKPAADTARQREIAGPAGPDPTRYGDWERKGRCIDF